jgi:hypothetical protein
MPETCWPLLMLLVLARLCLLDADDSMGRGILIRSLLRMLFHGSSHGEEIDRLVGRFEGNDLMVVNCAGSTCLLAPVCFCLFSALFADLFDLWNSKILLLQKYYHAVARWNILFFLWLLTIECLRTEPSEKSIVFHRTFYRIAPSFNCDLNILRTMNVDM